MAEQVRRAQSPSPDKYRSNWKTLNGIWEFSFDEPVYDREINVPFSWACPMSGIGERDKKGIGYYRKYEEYTKSEGRLFLVCEGVDYECEIKVNGVVITSPLRFNACKLISNAI